MKADAFFKIMLVLIALLLGIIVARPFFEPAPAAAASGGKLEDVQMWCIFCEAGGAGEPGMLLFSSKTGDLWIYPERAVTGQGKPVYIGTLTSLGEPFSKKAVPAPASPPKKP